MYVCILNRNTSFTCQNIIQLLHISKLGTYMPNKKESKNQQEIVDNKTQLSPKTNSNVITSAWRLQQKTFLQVAYCWSSSPTIKILISSQTPTTRYKNSKGEFIIKDQQTPNDND